MPIDHFIEIFSQLHSGIYRENVDDRFWLNSVVSDWGNKCGSLIANLFSYVLYRFSFVVILIYLF